MISSLRPLLAKCDLSSFGDLDMTKPWYSSLVVSTMCGNSRHLYEHDTIVCVCPIRLAHHDRIPPRQQIDRRQRYSIFRHHKKGHDSVQSPFNTMNGVNTLNLLPIPCRNSKESLIGALSTISSLAEMVLLTCNVSGCFTRLNDRSSLAQLRSHGAFVYENSVPVCGYLHTFLSNPRRRRTTGNCFFSIPCKPTAVGLRSTAI